MWFIFPQLAGLSHSPTAQFFALGPGPRAALSRSYASKPMRQHVCILLQHTDKTPRDILGTPDDLKSTALHNLALLLSNEKSYAEALPLWESLATSEECEGHLEAPRWATLCRLEVREGGAR
jgi:uncharacterized protein (DUF1810 family)